MIYSVNDNWSIFVNYGKAQREPADDQIIEADDIWEQPYKAAAEAIYNYELGSTLQGSVWNLNVNLYRIDYFNEQLKNIDVEQEGGYDYRQAGKTLHQGLEMEFAVQPSNIWSINLNSSISRHIFRNGDFKDNTLPNVPGILLNGSLIVKPINNLSVFLTSRYIGRQYIDDGNIGTNPEYWLFDAGMKFSYKNLELNAKINNLFDTLYSTCGYGYEWDGYWAYYWPGATRNIFVSMSVKL